MRDGKILILKWLFLHLTSESLTSSHINIQDSSLAPTMFLRARKVRQPTLLFVQHDNIWILFLWNRLFYIFFLQIQKVKLKLPLNQIIGWKRTWSVWHHSENQKRKETINREQNPKDVEEGEGGISIIPLRFNMFAFPKFFTF